MYLSYFGLDTAPFSIVPDHRALFMSQSHREAVAHLLYALNEAGGFVQLTGEVGTGKTTVSRYILANLPEDVDVALLLNPRITEKEMLESICDELSIQYGELATQKDLVSKLNDYLIEAHANGRKTVLIADEAQNLSREVLEQIRLLTNLETSTDKLLQIILIGQPELTQTLQRHDLRQLSQRIVGRFSLKPLNRQETAAYIEHRLKIAGVERPLFSAGAISRIHQLSRGIPRLINVLSDRALLGAYGQSKAKVDRRIVGQAAKEVFSELKPDSRSGHSGWLKLIIAAALPLLIYLGYQYFQDQRGVVESTTGSNTGHNTESETQSNTQSNTESIEVQVDRVNQIQNNVSPESSAESSRASAELVSNDTVAEEKVESNQNITNSTDTTPPQKALSKEVSEPAFDLTYRLGVPIEIQ